MTKSGERSAVAGILDGYGGWRTVVAPLRGMHHHVNPGELLLIVPNYKVQEPIPWNDIPGLIRRVDLYILEWIRTRNDPDTLNHLAVALFLLRRTRTYNCCNINLCDIVET